MSAMVFLGSIWVRYKNVSSFLLNLLDIFVILEDNYLGKMGTAILALTD
jgi:hypothetical protein